MAAWLDLGAAWLRIGLFGFGGGPSVVPLIRHECVERYGWMTDEELLDALAFGNALPGPIAVKLAAYVGLQVGGPLGCGVALLALNVPGVVLMLVLGTLYLRFKTAPPVLGILAAVRPAVIGLLAHTVFSLAPDGVKSVPALAIAVGTFVALVLHVHPAIVVAVAIVVGGLWLR